MSVERFQEEVLVKYRRVISAIVHKYRRQLGIYHLKALVTTTQGVPNNGDYLVLVDKREMEKKGYKSVFIENNHLDDSVATCFYFCTPNSNVATLEKNLVKVLIPLREVHIMSLRLNTYSGVFDFDWKLFSDLALWNESSVEELERRIEYDDALNRTNYHKLFTSRRPGDFD